MIGSDRRDKRHHCKAYVRLAECISITTVLALTICAPSTYAQVPERAFQRQQDAILQKQSEKPSPRRVAPPPVVKPAAPTVTKADLEQMNQNMRALNKSIDQLNETLKKLPEKLADQGKGRP